ncbi:MAG: hypothetical protein AB1757_29280 [Acidobacteriota bacterium]
MLNPNIALLTAVLSVITIVFSIFGASWLNQRSTERAIDDLKKGLEQRIGDLEKRFDERFKSLEQRLDRIERQLEAIFKPVFPPRS